MLDYYILNMVLYLNHASSSEMAVSKCKNMYYFFTVFYSISLLIL